MADLDRFLEKVDKKECWFWIAYCNEEGYGSFRFRDKVEKAHRVSWILFKGEIPEGKMVLHSCDKPCCVNPDHLFLGTDEDNKNDRQNKLRQARGSNHGSAIFTEKDVLQIRSLREEGFKIREIAEYFGAKEGTVANICSRQTWAWL